MKVTVFEVHENVVGSFTVSIKILLRFTSHNRKELSNRFLSKIEQKDLRK